MRRVEELEPRIWDLVSGLLKEPEQLRAGLDRMIELERRGMRGDLAGSKSSGWTSWRR